MKKLLLFVILVSLSARLSADNDFCGITNKSFRTGENISLVVFYNALGLYVNAGTANFTVAQERLNNKPVYHIIGTGTTNSKYDWIFRVRDRYETYIDTATLKPYKFIRNVDEGGYKIYQNITFNHNANTAITTDGVFKVPDCIQDVISSVFYARNIDFNKYRVGDKVPFKMFLDNEVYSMYLRYMGKEVIKTRYGKFRTIKFKPLLVKGTLFEGGEKMTVYVSDDANKVPVRIESPLIVGSVKVDLMNYQNLRYPLTSLISFR
ncbi:MAG: ATP-dependent exoDNAse [Segetibacter sp.]|nr:ATP-dependent exoDNAse [Segetibacter sp.]